jgi:cob(I)alamin adenosyltransferase
MAAQIHRFGASATSNSPQPNSSKVIGEALKAAAAGRRVLVVQFLKGGIHQGEGHMVNLAQNLDWIRSDSTRQFSSGELNEAEIESLQELWQHVRQLIRSLEYQLVVFEDLTKLLALGAIDMAEVDRLLQTRPASVEISIPGMVQNFELQAS